MKYIVLFSFFFFVCSLILLLGNKKLTFDASHMFPEPEYLVKGNMINNYSTSARWIWDDRWQRAGYNHLISNKREWNNFFIKSNQEILLDLADFALQEQTEDNLMVAIFRAWYNGSYTMAAKLINSLEWHYTMTEFLKIGISQSCPRRMRPHLVIFSMDYDWSSVN